MAAIPVNKPFSADETTITKLDLTTLSHTFTFVNYKQALVVENGEAVPITVNILGDNVTTTICPGLDPISLAAGYDFVIPALTSKTLYTSTRSQYLGSDGNNVVVTVTDATVLSDIWISES